MVSEAKRRARRQAAAAAAAAAANSGEEDDSSDSSSDSDADDNPRKRVKALTPSGRAAARVGLTGTEGRGGEAGTSGRKDVKNKEKPLVLSSRGIPSRYRHLMLDLCQLIPHCKKESKLDTKDERAVINEVAELQGCTSAVFFEVRKHQDLYVWLSKTPAGPTVKFNVTNVHTMSELKLTGNHLKGSRPVLFFDAAFDSAPHLRVMKEVFTHVFVTPRGHRKSKPFLDHVICFYWLDGRVWFRNYQAVWPEGKSKDPPELVEVGPRMVMNPIRIFAGSFRGQVLWSNEEYVSPNAVRRHLKEKHGSTYERKVKAKQKRKEHEAQWHDEPDMFKEMFKQ